MKTTEEIKLLKKEIRHLKHMLGEIVNDLYNLSICDGNRTEFSDELQGQIDLWRDNLNDSNQQP